MRVMYATATKRKLLIAGIMLLGCIAFGFCFYANTKRGDMEKIPVFWTRKEDQEVYLSCSDVDDDSGAKE